MNTALIKEFCILDKESKEILQKCYDKYKYSARSFAKFLKVSRTFADMDGTINIRKEDIHKALLCRDLEKEYSNMIVV